jgi:hypothetical protein
VGPTKWNRISQRKARARDSVKNWTRTTERRELGIASEKKIGRWRQRNRRELGTRWRRVGRYIDKKHWTSTCRHNEKQKNEALASTKREKKLNWGSK